MNRRKKDIIHFSILNVTWIILLFEHFFAHLELAAILSIVYGIVTIIFDIYIVCKYASLYIHNKAW